MANGPQPGYLDPDDRMERRTAHLRAHDPQVRDATPLPAIDEAIRRPGITLARTMATVMDAYADRPALAERARELVRDPETGRAEHRLLPRFDTLTYAELWSRVGALAAELHQAPHHPLRAGEFVAVLGFTGIDYATIDLACARTGAVCVPLQNSATADRLLPIMTETAPRVLAAGSELLDTAVDLALRTDSVRRLVVFDHRPDADDDRERFEAARQRLADAGGRVVVEALAEVVDRGRGLAPAPEFEDGDPDRLALLIYTSGSTGAPKGAMYTDRLVARLWQGFWPRETGLPLIGFGYLPMSHLAGRAMLFATLGSGGTTCFTARSDQSTLFEDLELARPTDLLLVPRVCDTLLQRYRAEIDRRTAEGGDPAALDAEVKRELRETFLGGRLLWVGCGSAPLSDEMAAFVESCVDLPLHDGYGSTEAGGVLGDHRLMRPPVRDYKLVDVPELGYFRTDLPHPRGELLLLTDALVPGYYRRPEVMAGLLDEDGYYRTGDIMAETGPDQLVYVDRRNNVLKLSQGEFVAVSHLEAVFASSPLVRQIFVHGSSERAYLLAVVVPVPEAVEQAGGDLDELKALIAASLQRTAKEAGLNSYEIPRDFLVETEPFSTANGLLSDIRKLLRPRLKDHYGERLEGLYTELAERENDELRALRGAGRDQPVVDTVVRAARALLGCPTRPTARFTDLGGDSLSALSFSRLLGEIFGVEVPVSVVISPANDLRRLAEHIERALSSDARRPSPAAVHGAAATEVRAGDLTLDAFVDAATLAAAPTLPHVEGPARTVLLTGASGYLGRFLCLAWLERLAATGGTLVCVVRGADAAAARERLHDTFDSGDPELLAHFEKLAEGRLEVLAGDIGEPDLGLDAPTWHRLARDVDLIVHPAALVNHVLPYEELFGPNVVGTAELIRMALTGRVKRFTYLSTVGVITAQTSSPDESADIRVTSPVRRLDDGYASGYATSKWAGEVLLREAHDLCGLPVATFRSDMILAHSRWGGQLNVPDLFTRLLLSVVATGIAPGSFYREGPDGGHVPAHYDGLPADFTAEAVTALGERATEGHHTYNVLNPHDDGVSLDTFVDWLADAGHPVRRIDDYDAWLARFETAMRSLPERQRQHSLLPLLHAFAVPAEPVAGSGLPADRFRAAVRAAGVGPDADIPHVSAALIHKYAADLRALKLI
ncbi:carboxylic acid reductase [Streptomyces griseoviridis]|uniref:carboxylic acid reductase n=1 Tax=Streptomyces griseoviridis TaxID=45398 RepID=UPI0033DD2684